MILVGVWLWALFAHHWWIAFFLTVDWLFSSSARTA